MTFLDADFLRRCECLCHETRRTWDRRFLARRVRLQLAGGTDVTGYSDYTAGDDFRYVDWNRCARHDELVSKQFRGSEETVVHLLLDSSGSMKLGAHSKFDAARRLTAALGYVALAHLDSVSVVVFSDRIVSELPALRGRKSIPRLTGFVDELTLDGASTDLAGAIKAFASRGHRTGLAIVISDFFDPAGFEPAIDILRRWDYEPFLVQVHDRLDAEPELLGNVHLHDVELGRRYHATVDQTDLANYRAVYAEFRDAFRRYCLRYSIGFSHAGSDAPFEETIQRMARGAAALPQTPSL